MIFACIFEVEKPLFHSAFKQVDRWLGMQAVRQAGRQAGGQAGRQVGSEVVR